MAFGRSTLVAATTRTSTCLDLGRADAANRAFLEKAQEIDLEVERQIADLVEEDRAAFGDFEETALFVDRAGERAPLVPEQLGLDQAGLDRAAVDRNERAFGARRLLMHGFGDQLLAAAALAVNEHRCLGACGLVDLTQQFDDGGALAQDGRMAALVRDCGGFAQRSPTVSVSETNRHSVHVHRQRVMVEQVDEDEIPARSALQRRRVETAEPFEISVRSEEGVQLGAHRVVDAGMDQHADREAFVGEEPPRAAQVCCSMNFPAGRKQMRADRVGDHRPADAQNLVA